MLDGQESCSERGARLGQADQRRGRNTNPLIALRAHGELSGGDGEGNSINKRKHNLRQIEGQTRRERYHEEDGGGGKNGEEGNRGVGESGVSVAGGLRQVRHSFTSFIAKPQLQPQPQPLWKNLPVTTTQYLKYYQQRHHGEARAYNLWPQRIEFFLANLHSLSLLAPSKPASPISSSIGPPMRSVQLLSPSKHTSNHT